MLDGQVLFAFALTLLAGLATGIGSLIAFFQKRTNPTFLSLALGFSGGVMIYVGFVELLPEGRALVGNDLLTTGAFFAGILFVSLIDLLVPHEENPHDVMNVEEIARRPPKSQIHRLGILTALAITIHNFPEGIATFMSALADPALGISIAIAVALHNIPEGISISVPIYYSTGSRKKAFWYSFLTGLAEPLGAIVAFLLLAPFLSDALLGMVFAGVAGIMVFIALDQLIPNAKKIGNGHVAVYGLIGGMGIMAATLLVL